MDESDAEYMRVGNFLWFYEESSAAFPDDLILNGKISKALACDINEKPLESAKSTVEENNVSDKVELRLCDGLCGVNDGEFTDLVIAGMGGELIVKILSACGYIKNEKYRLILQPMSKAYELRKYLCENGFEISDEKAAISNNKI